MISCEGNTLRWESAGFYSVGGRRAPEELRGREPHAIGCADLSSLGSFSSSSCHRMADSSKEDLHLECMHLLTV